MTSAPIAYPRDRASKALTRTFYTLWLTAFLAVFATNLIIFASEAGLLPFNAIVVFAFACGGLGALLLLTGTAELTADRLVVALRENWVPMALYLLWIALHVIRSGTSTTFGDVDLTHIFPLYQLVMVGLGMAAVAGDLGNRALRPASAFALLVLGASIFADNLFPGVLGLEIGARSGGFALNANVAAFLLNVLLVMALDFRRLRAGDVVMIAFVGGAVLMTLSRSGLAEFVIVLLAYFANQSRHAIATGRGRNVIALLMLGVLITVGAIVVLSALADTIAAADPEIRDRLDLLTGKGGAVYEDPYRGVLFDHFWVLGLERPWLGYGAGYTLGEGLVSAPLGLGPHNSYVRAWVDFGLVGLIIYTAIPLSLLTTALTRSDPNGATLALLILGYSFFSHNVIDHNVTLLTFGAALARTAPSLKGI